MYSNKFVKTYFAPIFGFRLTSTKYDDKKIVNMLCNNYTQTIQKKRKNGREKKGRDLTD